jgi:hypothetical protein
MRMEIRAVLDATRIDSDGNIDTKALFEPLVQLDIVWRVAYKKWLRDFQVVIPCLDVLHRAMRGATKSGIPQRLVDIVGEAKMQALENELFDFFSSLPRQYTVHFPIRTEQSLGNSEVNISKQLVLCPRSSPRPVKTPIPLNNLLGALSAITLDTWTTLRIPTSGYIESSADDSGSQTALSVLRQFVGMSIASGVMTFSRSNDLGDYFDKFEIIDSKSQESTLGVLPRPVSSLLKRVSFPADSFATSGAIPAGTMKIAQPLTDRFNAITRALNAPKEDGQHLRTAAEWLFDSEAESNETTALLFASIGLEAALDSPTKETTDRLGDRLAWSLGGSLSARKKMSVEYKEFYKVRCDVAHGRERRLDDKASEKLTWGRTMLRRIISNELDRPND